MLPLTRIFPCSKEILVLVRNLQGNKNTKIKGNCKDFCNLYQLVTSLKPVKINL
jgi:hypothetical protein